MDVYGCNYEDSVTVERCQFLTQPSSLPDRTAWSPRSHGEQADWSKGFSQECSACLSATGLFSGPTYPFAVTPASRGARGPFVTVVGSVPPVASWSEVASSAVCDPCRHDVVALWERLECRSTWTSPIRTTRSVLSFPRVDGGLSRSARRTLGPTGVWTLLVVSRKKKSPYCSKPSRCRMRAKYACGFRAGFIPPH